MRPALVAAAACLVLFVLGSCGTNASTKPAAGFLKTSGQRILDERGAPVLLRGVNLGGWLVPEGYLLKLKGQADRPRTINALVEETAGPAFAKDFWEAYRDAYVSEADIEAIAAAGFNHVRVPFNASLFLSEGPEEKWIDDGFNRLDDVIQWCSRHRLRVILDMHCAPGGQTGTNIDDDARNQPELWTDPENQRRAIELWVRIARRYRDDPTVIGYDLLNEPIAPQFSRHIPALVPFYRRAIAAIREVDSRHILFLEGANWANNFGTFSPGLDSNAVYSFHKYWNENNEGSIRGYLNVAAKHGVPLNCGEFGENNANWYADCTELLEEHGIGWCFWPWKKVESDNGGCSVPMPAGYADIVAFSDGGPKPSEEAARAAWNGLAENLKFSRCRPNSLVIDALLRASRKSATPPKDSSFRESQ